MARYSKIYGPIGNSNCGCRYDYEHQTLEMVCRADRFKGRGDKPTLLLFINWVTIRSAKLDRRKWEADPHHWVDWMAGGGKSALRRKEDAA